jgi:hypothetical protein
LSNLEADPSETKNVAASEPERVKAMIEVIREWEQHVGLKAP